MASLRPWLDSWMDLSGMTFTDVERLEKTCKDVGDAGYYTAKSMILMLAEYREAMDKLKTLVQNPFSKSEALAFLKERGWIKDEVN